MYKTLKSEFEHWKEVLSSEAATANKKYQTALIEVDNLKKSATEKEIRLAEIRKKESQYLSSLIQDSRPTCPRCAVETGKSHFMSPKSGTDKYDAFECKKCGLYLKFAF
jgi:tRNA(Ile2) C34 agmatinyltransferase TiaS